ncbi:beta strand repeat-containing protein [Asticcacaulis benevestitus]|uniref:Haemolysin-type calcium binding-related domain-containing protein n=1 Tax=Asticcacaulis benevestitus DSM 16100 = ATCC BAA-896 TaxID=1121022 RepID=V4RMW1_9CAUL|nr:calcium-binding protein [Asticcacaulis benevestitus]ESQ92573.1 hypothetical protein ABENE_08010 [Asticcacaulis benevestitus DSM 16100 = ATCC BAA-896]
MTITIQQAKSQLEALSNNGSLTADQFEAGVLSILDQLDLTEGGANTTITKTVLYSGAMGDASASNYGAAYAQLMGADGHLYRVIDRTDGGKFLSDASVKATIVDRLGSTRATGFLFGETTDSAWARVSDRFIAESPPNTQIIGLVPEYGPNRVFGTTELPRIVDTPNIVKFNDLPRTVIDGIYNDGYAEGGRQGGLDALRPSLSVTSADHIFNNDYGRLVDASGKGILDAGGNPTYHVPGQTLPDGATIERPNVFKPLSGISDVDQAAAYADYVKGASILDNLGVAGTAVGVILAYDSIMKDVQAGRTVDALATLSAFVAGFAGGELGAILAGGVAAELLGGLIAAGIIGGSLAGGIIFLAAAVGAIALGIVFEDAAKHIFHPDRPDPASVPRDPLVLDLDGDGVELLGVASSSVFFDIDADNFNERVGWVSSDDGLLVRDLNENGTIDGISELIGTSTQDAYTVLRGFDSNSDDIIDSRDAVWGSLKVWRDTNTDGVTDEGELHSLEDFTITNFSLENSNVGRTFQGNFVHSEATYTINGSTQQTRAVFFGVQQNQTEFIVPTGYVPDADVTKLPELVGGGSVAPLSYSMTNNAALKAQVVTLMQGAGSMSFSVLRSAVESVLFKWAGAESVVAGSRGSNIDAKHVAILEAFGGASYPFTIATLGWARNLEAQYQSLLTQYAAKFAIQSYGSYIALNYDGTNPSILDGHNYKLVSQLYVNTITDTINLDTVGFLDNLVASVNDLVENPFELIENATLPADIHAALDVVRSLIGDDLTPLISESGALGNTENSSDLDLKLLLLTLDAGGGPTGIEYGDMSANAWIYNTTKNYYGGAGDDTITGGAWVSNMLLGGDGNDHLEGDAGEFTFGNWGGDILVGGAGDDELDLNAVAHFDWGQRDGDILIGGTGNDSYRVNDKDDEVIEHADQGIDTVYTAIEYTLADNIENLVLEGYAAKGTGNALDNTITGDEYDNYLDGGAGADTLIGGGGNDTFVIDNLGDIIIAGGESPNSRILTSLQNYELGQNFVGLGLIGTDDLNASGNDHDNGIEGNSGSNILDARAGNDILDGGGGIDTLIGGLGDDEYYIRSSADIIVENSDEGYDKVYSSVSYTMSENVEFLELYGDADADVTGNSMDNSLQGNLGDNILIGGGGNDTLWGYYTGTDVLIGGSGDDTYHLSSYEGNIATIVENANEGIDLVLASQSYTLGDNIENVTIAASGDFDATGNALDNHLIGNSDANTLSGGLGNDTLDGGMGADQLIGGDGNDLYVIWDNEDTIVEAADGGQDIVVSHIDYALGGNLENLTLADYLDISGTGNDAANNILGNSWNNILVGRGGNDLLSGGWGVDRLEGGTGNDTLDGGASIDTAVFTGSFADYSIVRSLDGSIVVTDLVGTNGTDLLQKVEDAYFAGDDTTVNLAQLLSISGTANDDVIYGTAGNDEIHGLEGDDTLIGGEGGDYLLGGAGDDQVNFSGALSDYSFRRQANGQVTVQTATGDTTTLDSVEAVYFEGSQSWMSMTSAVGAYGTSGSDAWLAGTARSDALYGLDGDDTLAGHEGDDFIDGGSGDDQANYIGNLSDFVFNRQADGSITVSDTTGIEGTDRLFNVESVYFEGSQNWRLLSNLVADYGTPGDDAWLDGTVGNDLLVGLAGDDTLIGREGDDFIDGGDGSDQANYTGNRSDFSIYDAGNNTYYVMDLVGSEGSDHLENVEAVYFDGSSTWIDLTNYYNEFFGSSGNDNLLGDSGKDHMYGLEGRDSLQGAGGNDILDGGDGIDQAVYLGSFADFTFTQNLDGSVAIADLVGGQGQDTLVNIENIYFTDVDMRLSVENVFAILNGQPLNYYGTSIDNWLEGSQWTDNIYGYDGDDDLFGYGGDDKIFGGGGDDVANYKGAASGYDVALNLDGTVTVTDLVGSDGTDTLDGVEKIYFFSDGHTIYTHLLAPPGARMAMTTATNNNAAEFGDFESANLASVREGTLEAYAQVSISEFIGSDLYSPASVMRDAAAFHDFGRSSIADILGRNTANSKMVKEVPQSAFDLRNTHADIEQIRLKMVDAMAAFSPAESADFHLPYQPSLFRPEFANMSASSYRSVTR